VILPAQHAPADTLPHPWAGIRADVRDRICGGCGGVNTFDFNRCAACGHVSIGQLIAHRGQQLYARSTARFNVVPAGRRSGKTEVAKRRIVLAAMRFYRFPGRFICAAPTHQQARRIYWADILALLPKEAVAKVSHTSATVTLITGTTIACVGMERPERVEGDPIDGGILDEYGNMKPDVWANHVRPALSTMGRPGWMDFIGVPEGRNHFYDLDAQARADETGEWARFHWTSEELLDASEIASAKNDLDELSYQQEYLASFVTFQGRAYYAFRDALHVVPDTPYFPDRPLNLCLDFNRSPGTGTIVQEMTADDFKGVALPDTLDPSGFSVVIGEIHIPTNSTTPTVCRKFLEMHGDHPGDVLLYGDASGGNKTSSSVQGSDWELVEAELRPAFGGRLKQRYPRSNPPERTRVNSMNSRLRSSDGTTRLLLNGKKAMQTVKDIEGTRVIVGGAGEIDKKFDLSLTHLSDGLGYYVTTEFPIVRNVTVTTDVD